MGSFSQILSYVRTTVRREHTISNRVEFVCGLRQKTQAIGKRAATNESLHSAITRSYNGKAYVRSLDAQR